MNYHQTAEKFIAIWHDHCEACPADHKDKPAYRELWGIWLDGLRRDNLITEQDYFGWLPPAMPKTRRL